MDDARRAASAAAASGARRVLLFGSVARERAGPHSDIDLVAIYANLDYSTRTGRECELERAALDACGCRVHVWATDEPEWHLRTTQVRSSLEAHIAGYAIELAGGGDGAAVDWGKPIGRPHSDAADIGDRLQVVTRHITTVQTHEVPSRREIDLAHSRPEDAAYYRRERHISLLAGSWLAILAAARVMHAAALGAAPPKSDSLAELLAAQPGWVRDAFRGAIEACGAPLAEMHHWRDHGDEQPDRQTRTVDPHSVGAAADAAHAIASWISDHLPVGLDAEVLDRHRRWTADR